MQTTTPYPSQESINQIIIRNVAKATAISALPIPFIDTVGVALVQARLIESIAIEYHLSVENKKLTVFTSLVSSFMSKLITEAIISMTQTTKFDRIFGAAMIRAAIVSISTTAIGELYDRHFRNGGTIDNLNLDVAVSYIKDRFNSDELSIQNIGTSMMQKLIG